jgi:hypothetical protein
MSHRRQSNGQLKPGYSGRIGGKPSVNVGSAIIARRISQAKLKLAFEAKKLTTDTTRPAMC